MLMVSTMTRFHPQIVLVLTLLTIYTRGNSGSSTRVVGEQKLRCLEVERQALLKIKEDLHELKDGFLSSWRNEEDKRECCEWYGIQCANKSGHVIVLDLSPSNYSSISYRSRGDIDDDWRFLRGKISPSLIELKRLTYLDLSVVNFEGNRIPSFAGTLGKLRYLNLSHTKISGEIPPQLANLSSLQVLDLGHNYDLSTKSIDWISHLSSLRQLDLSQTNMSEVTNWMQIVNKLPYLTNLQLSQCSLRSIVPSSLSLVNRSTSLAVLDLSNNQLNVSVHQLVVLFSPSLVHLNLLGNMLEGSIPEALGNLTALKYLDLGSNDLEGFIPKALGNMNDLVYLSLSSNKLKGSIPEALGNLTALKYLHLDGNDLEGFIPKALGNMNDLVFLCLSLNKLKGSIPEALGNLTALTYLDLGGNNLEGEFPKSLWNLCKLSKLSAGENNLRRLQLPEQTQLSSRCRHYSLEYLDLGRNQIMGSLPNLTLFSSLKYLRLSYNQFSGTIPETVGQLAQLEVLNVLGNALEGVISKAHFSKLSKLSSLYLSDNSLILNVSDDWVPPFQLDNIGLRSCKLGPRFPKWLQTQKGYSTLGISNAGISDSIPNWFWDISTNCYSMDLSDNQIHGSITNSSFEFRDYPEVNLSSNKLGGSVPRFMFKVGALDLSENRFSKLNSLCNVGNDAQLGFLDISINQLSGELPDCWSHFKELRILVLANNKFSGKIPRSIGSLTQLKALNLGNNGFTQELPSSLKRCTNLVALNVGENSLFGPMPKWIGESLPNLVILSLRSNHFFGSIPSALCHLSRLQLMDLSSNNISGSLPKCLNNLTTMKESEEKSDTAIFHVYSYGTSGGSVSYTSYEDQVQLVWKGTLSEFRNTLGLVKSIDLSSNKLIGEIPTEITELVDLVFLNLSRNNLSEEIPSKIGKLKSLDALDLSKNQLSGEIPISLSQVDRLGRLDLSNNNLSGKIPESTQLQSFEASSYTGNPALCGAPLPKKCPGDEPTVSRAPSAQNEEDPDRFVTPGFFISLGLGFVVGFWDFCGTLIFNRTCRYSYFNFFNYVKDWIYIRAAIYKGKLLGVIKG